MSRRRARLSRLGDVRCLQALRTFGDFELDLLPLFQSAETLARDRRVVHEHVLTILLANEPEPLLRVEPLHMTNCHLLSPSVAVWSSSREGALPHTTKPWPTTPRPFFCGHLPSPLRQTTALLPSRFFLCNNEGVCARVRPASAGVARA